MADLHRSTTTRAPAKVNLTLAVGPVRPDGYHDLATVFQAVDLVEEVTVTTAARDTVTVRGRQAEHVPTDGSNLALRAVELLRERLGESLVPGIAVSIAKQVPVAGGMAGGSADAAATLVALDAHLRLRLSRERLLSFAAELGADVPFGIVGGTAAGYGRGDVLTPVLTGGRLHWVFALSAQGLSTPAVFRELDRLRAGRQVPEPRIEPALLAALRTGDPAAVGPLLGNDLQDAAVNLQPALADTLAVGRSAGALGALVSGSGPTTAFLAGSREAAIDIEVALAASGVCAATVRTSGPVQGAHAVG